MTECGRIKQDRTPCTFKRAPGIETCRFHPQAETAEAFHAREAEMERAFPVRLLPASHGWVLPGEKTALDVWQAGRCAACGWPRGGYTVLDHCHRTGLIRALLCPSCNIVEGHGVAEWVPAYRLAPPAVVLGWATPYWDARPEPWVVAALGARPTDPAAAARYLAAAARLDAEPAIAKQRAAGVLHIPYGG